MCNTGWSLLSRPYGIQRPIVPTSTTPRHRPYSGSAADNLGPAGKFQGGRGIQLYRARPYIIKDLLGISTSALGCMAQHHLVFGAHPQPFRRRGRAYRQTVDT